MKKGMMSVLGLTLGVLSAFGAGEFPGWRSTDREAIEYAAENGPDKYQRLFGILRLAQIDTPEKVNTYAKQCAFIKAESEKLGFGDRSLYYAIPLSTPQGKETWTTEGWHDAHAADSRVEMLYLVNTVESMGNARAELGDAGLFARYVALLTKHFSRYSPAVVETALHFMKPLLPAVDKTRAVTDLTHIRSRVTLVAEKSPAKWSKSLKMLDEMIAISNK